MKIAKILMILCLALGLTLMVGCGGDKGGDNNAKGSGGGGSADGGNGGGGGDAADAYALYKKKGRSWMHKNDASGNVSYMKYEIVEVADDHAMMKTTMCKDADGNPMDGMPEQEPTKIPFAAAGGTGDTSGPAPEVKEEKMKVEAGEFDCIVTEAGGMKTWSSKKYPGLVVKSEGNGMTMELIKFDE